MNKLYSVTFFLLIISVLFYFVGTVHAVAVGVSPPKLIFPENSIHLMNSNPYTISYSISGCDNFLLQRSGVIGAYSMVSILITPPNSLLEQCVLFVELESGVLSYGLAIPVIYDFNEVEQQSLSTSPSVLTGFFVEHSIPSQQNNTSFSSRGLFIILVCVCFAFVLFFIIRYV